MNDKYYIGFFKRDKLIAVMDLIMDYPKKKTAFIFLKQRENLCMRFG